MARKNSRPAKTIFVPRNPEKYVGPHPITLRSNWERVFAHECDTNDSIIAWAWESEKIPYSDPITGTQKIYIPDALVRMIDLSGSDRTVLIEIKPAHEALTERTRNEADDAVLMRNKAKWAAAMWWCERRDIEFKVMTEDDLFDNGGGTEVERVTQRQLKQKKLSQKKSKQVAKQTTKKSPKLPKRGLTGTKKTVGTKKTRRTR